MELATRFREFILLLTLAGPTLVVFVGLAKTARATHPFFKLWGLHCTVGERISAVMAELATRAL
jgi:hypothetical protein